MDDGIGMNDTLNVNIIFRNGNIGNISYFSNGSKSLKKEYLEVFSNGVSLILDDFKELYIYGKKVKKEKLLHQDKGHKIEIRKFIESIRDGKTAPISFSEIYNSTLYTFGILDSIKQKKTIHF